MNNDFSYHFLLDSALFGDSAANFQVSFLLAYQSPLKYISPTSYSFNGQVLDTYRPDTFQPREHICT